MSFLSAVPAEVEAAAQSLAGIRSTLAQANASVAAPTAGVAAAAEDQVSAGVAAFFGAFGQEYQVLGAQTQAFHEQFLSLLNAGAGAYLSTEAANAEQNLLNAVIGPVQGALSQPGNASAGVGFGAVGAAVSNLTAARVALFPLLGGMTSVGPLLGGGTPVGLGINGAISALQNGGAVGLLPGQLGAGLQTLSGGIARLPAAFTGLQNALAPALLQSGAAAGLATIEGPYQTLFVNTAANLQALDAMWSANPAPFLHQFINNQVGYAQTVAAGVQNFIQNLPAELANLPANIQAAIQAILAFNPVPYLQQFISNQIGYAQIIATSLQNAVHDFGTGLFALPAAFQSAYQALMAGNVGGAVGDIAQGFSNLFFTGFDVQQTGLTTFAITPTGSLAHLIPILGIPGQMAQNFTNLLPAGSIPAQMSQNFTNLIDTLMDTSITAALSVNISPLNVSLVNTFGLPVTLALDAVGAPIDTLDAFGSSATAFGNAVQTGDGLSAVGALIDAPAVIANGFLNGESTLPLGFSIGSFPTTIDVPLNGILVPPIGYTATVNTVLGPITVPVGGTPLSGIAAGLYYASSQLAAGIA